MNVLIVYAHPEPQSFNSALRDLASDVLTEAGHTVMVSDLYEMGFDPVAGPYDIMERANPFYFNLAKEQGHAADHELFSSDIASEIEKVKAADFLILQFPLWWFSMPAILKGWVDRVLAYKIAYGVGQWWDKGFFKGRRAMLSITTGTTEGAYATDGQNGDINRILWPLNGVLLRMCGYEVLSPFIAYGVPWVDSETRKHQMELYAHRLSHWQEDDPLFFHKLEDFGADYRLKAEFTPNTPGQHRS